MSMGFDPEVPAGYQDADIEQAEMIELGNRLADLEAKGICTHQGIRDSKNKRDLKVCTGCGETFRDRDAWDEAVASVIS